MPVIRFFIGLLKLIGWVDLLLGTIVFGIIAIIKGIYRSMTAQKEEPTHGDAAFATDKELKALGAFKPGGFLACVTPSKRKVYLGKEDNLLIIAKRGTGKTQAIKANLLDLKNRPWVTEVVEVEGNRIKVRRQLLPDIVMYDPKLSALGTTRSHLEAIGYRVFVIDIDNPENTEAYYNPVTYLDPNDKYDFPRQSNAIADLLAPDARYGKHSHFDGWPKIMLAGVMRYFLTKQPSRATIPHMIEQLIGSNEQRKALFALMKNCDEDVTIRASVDAYTSAGDREMGSFITTNYEKMNIWLYPSMKDIAERRDEDGMLVNTFTWEQIFTDDQPVAVFIRSGLGNGEGPLVRLIIGNAINSAKRMFNKTRQPLKKGLWVIVDEMPSLEKCSALLEVNRELREAGVNLMMCATSENDIKDMYQGATEGLFGGCSWLVYGESTEISWYERVSKVLGKRTAFGKAVSSNQHGSSSSQAETPVNLRNADQLAAMGRDRCVLIRPGAKVDGLKPFKIPNKKGRPVTFYS